MKLIINYLINDLKKYTGEMKFEVTHEIYNIDLQTK